MSLNRQGLFDFQKQVLFHNRVQLYKRARLKSSSSAQIKHLFSRQLNFFHIHFLSSIDSSTSLLSVPKAACASINRLCMIAPYLFIKIPITGKGISAAHVSFQLIVKPIIAMIISINVDESTNVKIPKPPVKEIAFKS